jgi:DNA polymerase-3 subunit beta
MIDAIKMITTISQEIKITLLSNTIIFNSLSADNVEAKTEIDIETGLNEKFELCFNSKYILDFISQIDKGEFILEFNEPSLPFVVKDDNFITIIMPIVA